MSAAQRTEGWYAARVGVKTASCFSDVMAKRDTKAYQGYMLQIATERVTGVGQGSDYINAVMQFGIDTEPAAKRAYEVATGSLIEECGLLLHPTVPFVGASPDGLIDADGLIECKCPKSTTHYEYLLAKSLPAAYRPQVQGQLWVSGRQWADFISFDPRFPAYAQLLIVRVERDAKYITELAERIAEFEHGVQAMMKQIEPTPERLAA